MSNAGMFSEDNQPDTRKTRGKSEKTKFIQALKDAGKTEEGFYKLCIDRAFDPDDNFAFKEVLNRLSPLKKSVAPMIDFKFPENGSPLDISNAIIKGIAAGKIPPDIGMQLNSSIAQTMKIQEVTDIDERLKVMESQIEQNQ